MGGSLIAIEAGCTANLVTKEKLLTQAMCTKPFSAVPNFRFQNNFCLVSIIPSGLLPNSLTLVSNNAVHLTSICQLHYIVSVSDFT